MVRPELRAFLWNARTNSTRGTKILLSTPPIGTRSEIELEWKELAGWCEDIGFRILERWPLALRYISRAFEPNALRADGVPACPIDWRRADLVLFECAGNRPPLSLAPEHKPNQPWNELSIGRICVRIRLAPAKDKASPILYEIVPNDVLPSVSRRDHRLQNVASLDREKYLKPEIELEEWNRKLNANLVQLAS